jgi:hypothetical protein
VSRIALWLLMAAAASPSAAAAPGVVLSASPSRLTLVGPARAHIALRNPGASPLVVDVSTAALALTTLGKPRALSPAGAARWLRVRPRRLRIPARRVAVLSVTARPPAHAGPGDHVALVLLTAQPPGRAAARIRIRLRLGIAVAVRVPGRIVHRVRLLGLAVHRRRRSRVLDLRVANRGDVRERIDARRLRFVLLRHGRRVARLAPLRRVLLPHSRGVVRFVYRGRLRGAVTARVELPSAHVRHTYRLRL